MREVAARAYRSTVDLARSQDGPRLVVAVGTLLVLVQLGFRSWALFPGWFFLDDYNLLHDATTTSFGGSYLMEPYNGHLMPAGRLVVYLVAASGEVNWAAAVTSTLVFQAVSSAAALWMLITLFGSRVAVLAPLVVYLTSALTAPALLWWAAAVTLLPLQAAFFLAIGSWVRYLRRPTRSWLVATLGSVVLGLLFDVKGLLVVPVMLFVACGYFATGRLAERLKHVVRTYRAAASILAVLVGGYVTYYLTEVPQVETTYDASSLFTIGDTMLGSAFPSGALGGPWRWSNLAPPTAFADPPAIAVHGCWVALVLIATYAALRRRHTMRAWVLLALYVVTLLVLVAVSRGATFGAVIGLEFRYLTDAVCVLALAIGLAFLPLRDATESSTPREEPLLTLRLPDAATMAIVGVVGVSGVISTIQYTQYWHSDNASKPYLENLRRDLGTKGDVDLADTVVPEDVLSQLTAPLNTTSRLARLVSDGVSFPDATDRLAVVSADGELRSAAIATGVTSVDGPVDDCGWPARSSGVTIPLTDRAFEWTWWIRFGYLGSQDSDVVVTVGEERIETQVEAGLNSLYVRVDGTFDEVRISGLSPGAFLCIDTVEVGQPVPGGELS